MLLIPLDNVHERNIERLVHEFGEPNRTGVHARYINNMLFCEENPMLNGDAPIKAYRLTRDELKVVYGNR